MYTLAKSIAVAALAIVPLTSFAGFTSTYRDGSSNPGNGTVSLYVPATSSAFATTNYSGYSGGNTVVAQVYGSQGPYISIINSQYTACASVPAGPVTLVCVAYGQGCNSLVELRW